MRPDYGLWQIAKLRNSEMMREVQEWHLLRRSVQPTGLDQQIHRLLRRLGHAAKLAFSPLNGPFVGRH